MASRPSGMEGTEVFYLVTHAYAPDAEGGVRWNDPLFKIDWPLPVPNNSEKDAGYPDCRPEGA